MKPRSICLVARKACTMFSYSLEAGYLPPRRGMTSRPERRASARPLRVRRFAAAAGRSGSWRWPFRPGRYEMALRMASINLERAGTASGVAVNAGENKRACARSCAACSTPRSAAADPARAVAAHMPAPVAGRTVVVGAGKASAAMARAFEANWSGPLEGLVVTRARPRRRLRPDRDRRGEPSGAGSGRRGGGPPHSRSGARPRGRRTSSSA